VLLWPVTLQVAAFLSYAVSGLGWLVSGPASFSLYWRYLRTHDRGFRD